MISLGIYSIGLWLIYALIVLAVVLMFAGIGIAIAQNMKEGGMTAIIALVAVVVLFGIGYAMSSNVVSENLQSFIQSSGFQLSSGALITFYIMVSVAAVAMVAGMIKDAIS